MTKPYADAVNRAREDAIITALAMSSGNVAHAAIALGVKRAWVHRLARKRPRIAAALRRIRRGRTRDRAR